MPHSSFLRFFLGLFILLQLNIPTTPHAREADLFPIFPSIRPNVNFWKRVFSEHPSTKGFIHDSMRLDIIYEVMDLVDDEEMPEARQINRLRVDEAKVKYGSILQRLGAGHSPETTEEIRVYKLFGKSPRREEFLAAAQNIRFQTCMRERFVEGIFRSHLYLDEMKKILRSHDVPEDLVYLPHVESSFNYKACSKAGAVGVWQFTKGTGKRYLTINDVLDERRDPIKATHAAARYLRGNHQLLGDWPLAITSYNHGETGILRAKNMHGSYVEVFHNYESPSFKFASRNFYSEFLAAREVAKNYKVYFGDLVLPSPLSTQEVELQGYVPVRDLAGYLRLDLDTLRDLNPALDNAVFAGSRYIPKGYRLRVPASKGPMMARYTPPALHDKPTAHESKKTGHYQVRSGDTASSIARRHGVRLADLIAENGLGDKATVQLGQRLRIPSGTATITKAGKQASAAKEKKTDTVHVVSKGDTITGLANHYETSVSRLLAANNLDRESVIQPGQKIVIPDAAAGGGQGKGAATSSPRSTLTGGNSKKKPKSSTRKKISSS